MDADDRENFFVAADLFQCWIGVRDPNELASAWSKETGYIPKPEWCKAMTADNPDPAVANLAGLVVDPTARPDAFVNIARAEEKWAGFLEQGQLPDGFTRVEDGEKQGLILYEGCAIFSDYDLMTVVPSNDNGDWLRTEDWETVGKLESLSARVIDFLNRRLPKPMIQHGPEFLFGITEPVKAGKSVGGKHGELVLWFGPGCRFMSGPSSVDKDYRH